jgi:hypothetical protein
MRVDTGFKRPGLPGSNGPIKLLRKFDYKSFTYEYSCSYNLIATDQVHTNISRDVCSQAAEKYAAEWDFQVCLHRVALFAPWTSRRNRGRATVHGRGRWSAPIRNEHSQ